MTYLPELTKEEIIKMLNEERVGRIGLNDNPQPYVVPTDFAFVDGAIYIHTPESGLKARLARLNPNVCFEVDRFNEKVTDFRSVIIRGKITEVSDTYERSRAMRSLSEKAVDFDFVAAHGNRKSNGNGATITIFKIEIEDITGIRSPGNGHN